MGLTVLPFTGTEVIDVPANLPINAQTGSMAVVQSPFNLYIYDGSSWRIGNSENFLPSVDVATTANIVLSGEQTIDGVLTSVSNVLVKNQSLGQNNGIYVSGAGAWTRRSDANTGAALVAISVWVTSGTANINTAWNQIVNNIVLGTTVLTFVQTDAEATNFVDLTSNQNSIGGNKTFTGNTTLKGSTILGNASANYVTVSGVASNSSPIVAATGSDSNVSLNLATKAAGAFNFLTETSVQQFRITDTASAVNYISVTGAITTAAPVLSTVGSDTNISLTIAPKGSGSILLPNTVNLSALSASLPLQTDSSKNIVSSQIVLTTGVTGVLPIANGGSNSSTALNNGSIMISAAGAIVEQTALTASRVVVSDPGGLPISATTTVTELGYVHGVTSAIQTQLDLKAPLANPTFTGTVTAAATTFSGINVYGYQYSAPSTGNSITMTKSYLLIHAAGTLAALTVVLPATPVAGQKATFASDVVITALTVTGTTDTVLTSLVAGGYATFMYESTNSTWFRIG